jgi:uncharacterized protein YndB with AHSA1/START domain
VSDLRVEHQAEVDGSRAAVFALVATEEGLRRWLDDAELDPQPGGRARFRMLQSVAIGKVLAVDPPQHLSLTWDWEAAPLGVPSVVAFDLIDHGRRTHLTVRHVGFRTRQQWELHDALWRHWFGRLVAAARDAIRDH